MDLIQIKIKKDRQLFNKIYKDYQKIRLFSVY